MTIRANDDQPQKYSQSRIRHAALTPMPIENWNKKPFKYHGESLISLLFKKPEVFFRVYDWLVKKRPATYVWVLKEMGVLLSAVGHIKSQKEFAVSLYLEPHRGLVLTADSINKFYRDTEKSQYMGHDYSKAWKLLETTKDIKTYTTYFKDAHRLPEKFDMDVYLKWLLPDTQVTHFRVQPARHKKSKTDEAARQPLLF